MVHCTMMGMVSTVRLLLNSRQTSTIPLTTFSPFFLYFFSFVSADLAGAEMIKFGIESKFSCPDTSTALFKDAISASLQEMKQVIEGASLEDDKTYTARL